MDLFNSINPQTQKLIDENIDIVNECLSSWIKAERTARSGIAKRVLSYLSSAKQKRTNRVIKIIPTDKRIVAINKLVRLGYDYADITKVIDYKIFSWWDTDFKIHLTPETLFAIENFPKYYEEAQSKITNEKQRTPEQMIGVIKMMNDED